MSVILTDSGNYYTETEHTVLEYRTVVLNMCH